jgi:hypothetical protein
MRGYGGVVSSTAVVEKDGRPREPRRLLLANQRLAPSAVGGHSALLTSD